MQRWLRLLQLLAQAEGAHVGPDLLDVGEALRLVAALPDVCPAERILTAHWPDGILFLVVDDHSVDSKVFEIVPVHRARPPLRGIGLRDERNTIGAIPGDRSEDPGVSPHVGAS